MFLTLTGHRTLTLTRSHDLEALTGDTEKGGGDGESKSHIDILLSALAANNQNKWLFFVWLKSRRARESEPVMCMCVLIACHVPVIPRLISIEQLVTVHWKRKQCHTKPWEQTMPATNHEHYYMSRILQHYWPYSCIDYWTVYWIISQLTSNYFLNSTAQFSFSSNTFKEHILSIN